MVTANTAMSVFQDRLELSFESLRGKLDVKWMNMAKKKFFLII